MSVNINNIPTFLKARSPKGLGRLMLSNNISRGAIFNYNIMQDIKTGLWYAWFQADAKMALEEMFEDKPGGQNVD